MVTPPNPRSTSPDAPESSSLSTSTLSTPSIADDNDPISPTVPDSDAVADPEAAPERRGRSATIDSARYEMDPRNMSPRRDYEELDQLGAETKANLEAQAQSLQSGLLALLDRVEKVAEDHDKLEAENRFLQEYIGSLMATSKITGSSASSSSRSRNSGGRLK